MQPPLASSWPPSMATSDRSSTSDSFAWKVRFCESVYNWVPPTLLATGLLSNVCAFAVLLRPRMWAMVVHLPLLVLSVVDTLALLTGLLRHWLRKATYFVAMGNLDPQSTSDASCKVLELLLYLSLMYSSWLVTLISVERFVTVCLGPSRLRAFLVSRRGLLLTMSGGLCCLLAVNLHFFVTRGLAPGSAGGDARDNGTEPGGQTTISCRNLPEHAHFLEVVFPKLDLTFTAFVPFLVIAACNLRIVCKLRSARRQSSLSSSQSAIAGYRTTVMLLLTTFVFIVLTAPAKLYLTVLGGTQPQALNPALDPDAFHTYRVIWSILLVLQFANHCCNFLLYCVSNPQFRSEAIGLFLAAACCCCGSGGGSGGICIATAQANPAVLSLRPERSFEDEQDDENDEECEARCRSSSGTELQRRTE